MKLVSRSLRLKKDCKRAPEPKIMRCERVPLKNENDDFFRYTEYVEYVEWLSGY